ncbi:MAG: hypothetical protein ACRDKT_09935, partial [Actinomycetota bacterium]
LSIFQYERVRANPLWFFVADGHEIGGVEDVVERNDGYNIVRKKGVGSVIAQETDTRANERL